MFIYDLGITNDCFLFTMMSVRRRDGFTAFVELPKFNSQNSLKAANDHLKLQLHGIFSPLLASACTSTHVNMTAHTKKHMNAHTYFFRRAGARGMACCFSEDYRLADSTHLGSS